MGGVVWGVAWLVVVGGAVVGCEVGDRVVMGDWEVKGDVGDPVVMGDWEVKGDVVAVAGT